MQSQPTTSIAPAPPDPVRASLREAADAYRASVAWSLEAARRHDQLIHRFHAVESARALLHVLFGLEGWQAPDVEDLSDALTQVEAAQDWPAGYLHWALLHLLRDPAPRRQIELARRVERLLASRGLPSQPIPEPGPWRPRPPASRPARLAADGSLRAGPEA